MSAFGFVSGAVLLVASATASFSAVAQSEPVGFVKTITGEAFVTTSGQRVKAQAGTPVLLGSQIKTSPGASMGVTFRDNTVMSFGSDTELTVDEYLYSPGKGDVKMGTSLSKGTLNYVSGMIAKLKPDAVSVKTPTGTLVARGTHFVATVDPTKK